MAPGPSSCDAGGRIPTAARRSPFGRYGRGLGPSIGRMLGATPSIVRGRSRRGPDARSCDSGDGRAGQGERQGHRPRAGQAEAGQAGEAEAAEEGEEDEVRRERRRRRGWSGVLHSGSARDVKEGALSTSKGHFNYTSADGTVTIRCRGFASFTPDPATHTAAVPFNNCVVSGQPDVQAITVTVTDNGQPKYAGAPAGGGRHRLHRRDRCRGEHCPDGRQHQDPLSVCVLAAGLRSRAWPGGDASKAPVAGPDEPSGVRLSSPPLTGAGRNAVRALAVAVLPPGYAIAVSSSVWCTGLYRTRERRSPSPGPSCHAHQIPDRPTGFLPNVTERTFVPRPTRSAGRRPPRSAARTPVGPGAATVRGAGRRNEPTSARRPRWERWPGRIAPAPGLRRNAATPRCARRRR